jgi:hypothetical protein
MASNTCGGSQAIEVITAVTPDTNSTIRGPLRECVVHRMFSRRDPLVPEDDHITRP